MDTSLKFGYATDVGKRREHNEDALAYDVQHQLWVVADGMGGHESGDVASQITAQTLVSCFKQDADLDAAIQAAHEAVKAAAARGEGKPGMGSTVVALAINALRVSYAWVGDSRIYLFSDGFRQLTKDHSYVQFLIDQGQITEAEAKTHPKRNVITHCVGFEQANHLDLDSDEITVKPGDKLLLCSDGLTNEVSDEEMAQCLSSDKAPQVVVDELMSLCLSRKASDNVTLIVIEIGKT